MSVSHERSRAGSPSLLHDGQATSSSLRSPLGSPTTPSSAASKNSLRSRSKARVLTKLFSSSSSSVAGQRPEPQIIGPVKSESGSTQSYAGGKNLRQSATEPAQPKEKRSSRSFLTSFSASHKRKQSTVAPPQLAKESLFSSPAAASKGNQKPIVEIATPDTGFTPNTARAQEERTPTIQDKMLHSAGALKLAMPLPRASLVLPDDADEEGNDRVLDEALPKRDSRQRYQSAWAAPSRSNSTDTATSPSSIASPLFDAASSSLSLISRAFSPPTRSVSIDSSVISMPNEELAWSKRLSAQIPPPDSAEAYASNPASAHLISPRLLSVNGASWRFQLPSIRAHLPSLLRLALIFVVSTAIMVAGLSTLPLKMPTHGLTELTITELREMAYSLKDYSESTSRAGWHTWLALMVFFTWKQAFSVPGSLIMNVVLGALYGTYRATFYTSILTGIGGAFCYLLARPMGPLVKSLPGLNKGLSMMRNALSKTTSSNGSNADLWSYLLLLRLAPIVPWGLMNVFCGILHVPLWPFYATLTFGSIPWNFVTCQIGDILQGIIAVLPQVAAQLTVDGAPAASPGEAHTEMTGLAVIGAKIWSTEMMFKLFLLSTVSLVPVILGRYLKRAEKAPLDENNVADTEESHEQVPLTLGLALRPSLETSGARTSRDSAIFAPQHSRAPSFTSFESSDRPYDLGDHSYVPVRVASSAARMA